MPLTDAERVTLQAHAVIVERVDAAIAAAERKPKPRTLGRVARLWERAHRRPPDVPDGVVFTPVPDDEADRQLRRYGLRLQRAKAAARERAFAGNAVPLLLHPWDTPRQLAAYLDDAAGLNPHARPDPLRVATDYGLATYAGESAADRRQRAFVTARNRMLAFAAIAPSVVDDAPGLADLSVGVRIIRRWCDATMATAPGDAAVRYGLAKAAFHRLVDDPNDMTRRAEREAECNRLCPGVYPPPDEAVTDVLRFADWLDDGQLWTLAVVRKHGPSYSLPDGGPRHDSRQRIIRAYRIATRLGLRWPRPTLPNADVALQDEEATMLELRAALVPHLTAAPVAASPTSAEPRRERGGHLSIADVRRMHADLDERQIEAVRGRLKRWREAGDNERLCKQLVDTGTGREEWHYPPDVVAEKVTGVRDRP